MHKVMQKVYLLAATSILDVNRWLSENFNCEEDDFYNDQCDGELLTELAGRRCYLSFKEGLNPNVTKLRHDNEAYLKNIIDSGHGSVLEHVNTVWAFENVSRVFTHELVRHRVGIAISQESLRYVRLTDFDFWIPPIIGKSTAAVTIFIEAIKYLQTVQKELARLFDIDNKSFKDKKELTSAFRRLAPMGLATGIVWSANLRALRHVIEMRTSIHAEEEMRIVFSKVAELCADNWPMIFQDMKKDEQSQYTFARSKV